MESNSNKNGVLVLSVLSNTLACEYPTNWEELDKNLPLYVLADDYCDINKKAGRNLVKALFFESEHDATKAINMLNGASEKNLGGIKMAKSTYNLSEEDICKIANGRMWSF